MRYSTLFILLALHLTACSRQEEKPTAAAESKTATHASIPAPAPTITLLSEKITPHLVETPATALPVWRQFRDQAPPLVLLANYPFLLPVPSELKSASLQLVKSGSNEEVARKGTALTADPFFLPEMSVRLALEAGLISRLVWIFPANADTEKLDVDLFRKQLVESGMITAEEGKTLTLQDGCFAGTIADKPFLACHPAQLPMITEPILLHIDLTYFQPHYKGEIKTPLYPLLGSTLSGLKAKRWPTLAVSISVSNIEGGVPLASRFVQGDLGALFEHPEYLTSALPKEWGQRAQALYLENFFQKEKVREIYLGLEKNDPRDPSLKFALYGVERQFQDGDKAMGYLRQAVALDRSYGLEYLNLARLAHEKKLVDQTIRMLELAQQSMPENPFITLQIAENYEAAGDQAAAEKLLGNLRSLPWSKVYYPDLPSALPSFK
jgi:hypothetical protein